MRWYNRHIIIIIIIVVVVVVVVVVFGRMQSHPI
jgi:putative copper export protein